MFIFVVFVPGPVRFFSSHCICTFLVILHDGFTLHFTLSLIFIEYLKCNYSVKYVIFFSFVIWGLAYDSVAL